MRLVALAALCAAILLTGSSPTYAQRRQTNVNLGNLPPGSQVNIRQGLLRQNVSVNTPAAVVQQVRVRELVSVRQPVFVHSQILPARHVRQELNVLNTRSYQPVNTIANVKFRNVERIYLSNPPIVAVPIQTQYLYERPAALRSAIAQPYCAPAYVQDAPVVQYVQQPQTVVVREQVCVPRPSAVVIQRVVAPQQHYRHCN